MWRDIKTFALDKNNDRRITSAEFRGQLPFGSFDINQDGAVSKAEFLATHRSMFMRFDVDANQRISMREFATAQRAAANQAIPLSHVTRQAAG